MSPAGGFFVHALLCRLYNGQFSSNLAMTCKFMYHWNVWAAIF